MKKEFSDIWIHDDEQLENLFNVKIITREKLSHWPLSFVEKVTLINKTQYIYKSQHSAASVEKEFYTKNKTPFLPPLIYSGVYENCDIMIMPYLDYPPQSNVSEPELEQIILDISGIIQGFSDMPVFFDISSVDRLARLVETVCAGFIAGGDSGGGGESGDDIETGSGGDNTNSRNGGHNGFSGNIDILKKWITEKAYVCYDSRQIGYVHGDLTAANILTDNGKMRYILDWQRPMVAPVMLECALAFRLAGYDAGKKYSEFGLLATICHFIWYAYAYKKFIRYEFIYNHAKKLLSEFITSL